MSDVLNGETLPEASTPTEQTRRRRKLGTRDGLFQRAGFWWIDFSDGQGKRHRKKAAPDYQTAKLIYRDTVAKIARGEVLGVREEGIRVRHFIEKRYWPSVAGTLAPVWAARSREILDVLIRLFGGRKLASLRQEEIERWVAGRRGQVKASTANKELTRLKHLLKCAVDWGYLRASPAAKVKKAKEPTGRVRYLTAEERHALLEGIEATVTAKDGRAWTVHHRPSPKLRLYILVALHTGARRSELGRLTWRDVDLRQRTVTFHGKNGHDRTMPMTDTVRTALQRLPRPLDGTAPALPPYADPKVLTRTFARLVQRLGIAHLTFHDLRHDVGSQLTMAGVPQRSIMEVLGHRDPRMTVRYQHLAPGHLRDAMQALERAVTAPPAAANPHADASPTGTISAPASR